MENLRMFLPCFATDYQLPIICINSSHYASTNLTVSLVRPVTVLITLDPASAIDDITTQGLGKQRAYCFPSHHVPFLSIMSGSEVRKLMK